MLILLYIYLSGGELVKFNENEYCIEMDATELCSTVSHASDLDSRAPSEMNVHNRSFADFLSQMPDYDARLEPLRQLVELHNTAQLHGSYYTVSATAHRAYRSGDIGIVDLFLEKRFFDESALPSNYEVSLLKTHAYFYACRNALSRVDVRLVFCYSDSKKIKIIEDSYTVDSLKSDYFALIERVSFFAELMLHRKNDI